ncbi:MAG: serine protease [Sphingobium sp.]|nr:serine protease [Sphingobium sp.]
MTLTLRTPFFRILSLLALSLLSVTSQIGSAHAEQADVAATVRGVVRVVIIATNGEEAYFVGHGSGFAVAPDKVLTNAHVVELLRTEPNLVVGIIPSQGKKSYGGKVIAYSPGNDLALIQLKEGRLPVSTFFAGAVEDGQSVTAIGYPGSVDRAQGLDLNQMTHPLSPVKTSGTVSMGRASQGFDTLLHTAPMAQGNSGGPLVDDCGRVLGVNSFGSQSESTADAEFGFAISNREVASFLRQAGVQFQRTSAQCRSISELDAEEAKRAAEDQAKKSEQARLASAERDKAVALAREKAEQQVYSSRENAVAIAGLLLVLGGVALAGAMMFHIQGREKERLWAGVGGGVLLLGALIIFLMRPSFSNIDEAIDANTGNSTAATTATQSGYQAIGNNLCRLDENRSRITVSDGEDALLNWTESGCVNKNTQYGQNGAEWSRIFVPGTEDVITINSFAPATGTYKVERYLADEETLTKARQLRQQFRFDGCTASHADMEKLQQMQAEIRSVLPAHPNERLVYQCNNDSAKATKTPQTPLSSGI